MGKVHGEARAGERTHLYNVWLNMKSRCRNPNRENYQWYGDRGIKVCKEWRESYTAFRDWALENGYSEDLEIDRIDNDGDYCPENCRWVTDAENKRNSRSARKITFQGETKAIIEWAEEKNIKYTTLVTRFNRGWSVERALTQPIQGRKDGSS